MLSYILLYQDWAPLILRVVLGIVFVVHGYPKLSKRRAGFISWLDSLGIKPAKFWGLVVGVVETFGGLALILGVFTEIAAALIAINMLVAMAKVKWGKMKFVEMEKAGWELDLIYFAVAISLVLTGPGAYALGDFLPIGY